MRKIKSEKIKKVVLKLLYRLRNSDELLKIEKNFINNGFEIVEIEEYDKREFSIEKIMIEIKKIKEEFGQGTRIVFLSNIKDVLLASYRMYNDEIDDFIFFIDKYNYDILKKESILEKIADFKNMEQDRLKGKIYINIEFVNFMSIFDFLLKNNNFYYFDNMENFNYEIRIEKKNILKKYYMNKNGFEIEIGNGKEKIEIKEDENIREDDFYLKIDKSRYFIVFYIIGLLRKYSLKDVREKTVLLFKFLQQKKTVEKQKIAEIIYSTKGIAFLEFKEKIGIFSLMVLFELPFSYLSNFMFKIMKEDTENNEKYFPAIVGDMINYMNMHGLNPYRKYGDDFKSVIKKVDDFYCNKKEISKSNNYNSESKKIAFFVDNLTDNNYSVTKFAFDIVKNIKKYNPDYKIKIFVEDNFSFIEEEIIPIYTMVEKGKSSAKYHKEHMAYFEKEKDIEIMYSLPLATKDIRVKDIISAVFDYDPEVVMTTTLCSYSINTLYKYYPTMYLSMVSYNFANNFDIQLYPHIEHIESKLKEMGKKIEDGTFAFEYGAEFEKQKNKIYNREEFGFGTSDFIMITVGIRLKKELSEEYINMIGNILKKNKNIKWCLVGETEFPIIEKCIPESIKKQIVKIKYEKNLGALYRICDIYINPTREGGGFSMAEAIVNEIPVVSDIASPSGKHYIGENNCVKNNKEYVEEIEKLSNDKFYYLKKIESEIENLKKYEYEGIIKKLMEFERMAKAKFIKRSMEGGV